MKNLFILALIFILLGDFCVIRKIQRQNDTLRANQETLMAGYDRQLAETQKYKVADSLNAARAGALELSLKAYKDAHKKDYELIKQLKKTSEDLNRIANAKTESVVYITTEARQKESDSVLYFDYKSYWTDVAGRLDLKADTIDLQIKNRDALKIIETVTYKRFLGFLWKTNKVKSRQVEVVSENPSTQILNAELIVIE